MGFRVGYRPSFPFPGIWLYQHEEQSEFGIVHIIGLDRMIQRISKATGALALTSHEVAPIRSITSHSWRKTGRKCAPAAKLIGSTMWSEVYPSSVCTRSSGRPSGITLELHYPASEGSAE